LTEEGERGIDEWREEELKMNQTMNDGREVTK
jgi:hypothetical protein